MRKIFLMPIFVLLGWGTIPLSQAVVDRVAAVVNQEIITLSEVEKRMGPVKEELLTRDRLESQRRLEEMTRKTLDQLIEERLIDQEARRAGVRATGKEVDEAVEEVRKRNGVKPEEMEKLLAGQGLTLEAFKKQVQRDLQRMKLIRSSLKLDTKAGENELRAFHQANLSRYQGDLTYRPSHILFVVPKGAPPDQVRDIRRKCEKVLEKIKAGGDFGEMALLYSEDLSAKDQGDLGYFKKGELLPVFEREALRLPVGGVSGVIRTEYGFHLIKLLDRKGGEPRPFGEVKEKVEQDYQTMAFEKAYQQYLGTLKAKAVIEIKL